ncbi:MAG: phosphoglucosamine mutase [Clostridiales Family XIII bacterium]|jgi:phosphoglucosamine mutase|nr:phosphoglucosamine mutase [Clostridiales Family XIII bacterium]
MGKLFGTDGVRGVANKELTPELACALGKAGTYILSSEINDRPPSVIIGKDTRISGDMLEDGLAAGILSAGGNVIRAGVMSTPAIAFLVHDMGADCGVVISASHNTFEYNGIKFFNSRGYKLDDAIENRIEEIALTGGLPGTPVSGESIGRALECEDDALSRYANHMTESIGCDISGLKLVVDCANGASCAAAKTVFGKLNAQAHFIGDEPNGTNINDGFGSTHPEALRAAVIATGADLGLAFDGDADRLIAVDENGGIMDGDHIMYICAKHMKERGELTGNRVTATVMSNIGLRLAFEQLGIELDLADVGDRYVLELMQKTGCVLGGEQSGHIIFLDKNTTGDGLFAGLRLIEALAYSGKKASEASAGLTIYPQVLKNAAVKNEHKKTFRSDPEIAIAIEKIEVQMKGEGRVLIRPSGTEPLVRVMIEGADAGHIEREATILAELIEKKLG